MMFRVHMETLTNDLFRAKVKIGMVLLMLASDIKDFLVYSKDMVSLGKVKDVEFDPLEMKLTNIIVDFEKEAAKEVLGKRIVLRHAKGRVPVTAVESIKDALNLAMPWKDLKGAFTSL